MTDVSTPTDTPALEPVDPFGGDSKTFDLTQPVNLSQLRDEIAERTEVDVHLAVSVTDPFQPISEVNPAVLYVTPGDVDGRTVHGAIQKHEPDEHYGIPEEQKNLGSVIEKLAKGETLEQADVETALKYLLSARG